MQRAVRVAPQVMKLLVKKAGFVKACTLCLPCSKR